MFSLGTAWLMGNEVYMDLAPLKGGERVQGVKKRLLSNSPELTRAKPYVSVNS